MRGYHSTFRVTRSWLRRLGACKLGLARVSRWLPVKISTDPERNLSLVIRVIRAGRLVSVTWLVRQWSTWHWPLEIIGRPFLESRAWILAQELAPIADAELTRRGR